MTSSNHQSSIEWTRSKLDKLKREYTKALHDNAKSFTFENHKLLVIYTKYLIEYLDNEFKDN